MPQWHSYQFSQTVRDITEHPASSIAFSFRELAAFLWDEILDTCANEKQRPQENCIICSVAKNCHTSEFLFFLQIRISPARPKSRLACSLALALTEVQYIRFCHIRKSALTLGFKIRGKKASTVMVRGNASGLACPRCQRPAAASPEASCCCELVNSPSQFSTSLLSVHLVHSAFMSFSLRLHAIAMFVQSSCREDQRVLIVCCGALHRHRLVVRDTPIGQERVIECHPGRVGVSHG